MDLVDIIQSKQFISREFLTWLWFMNEIQGQTQFEMNGEPVEISLATRTRLSAADNSKLSIDDEDDVARHHSIQAALRTGKKIDELTLFCEASDINWSVRLDSLQMNFTALKFPKIPAEDADESTGVVGDVHDRAATLQMIVASMESLFETFLRLRVSPEWKDFLKTFEDAIESASY